MREFASLWSLFAFNMRQHWLFALVYATFKTDRFPVSSMQRFTLTKTRQGTQSSRGPSALWSADYVPQLFLSDTFQNPIKDRTKMAPPLKTVLCREGWLHWGLANCHLKQKKSPKIKPGGKPVFSAWIRFTGCCNMPENSYINQNQRGSDLLPWPSLSDSLLTISCLCWEIFHESLCHHCPINRYHCC